MENVEAGGTLPVPGPAPQEREINEAIASFHPRPCESQAVAPS